MIEFQANDFLTSEDNSDFLGRGSYAFVRRCQHKELGRVVVKCFNVTGSSFAVNKHSDHIRNEANVLWRLQHKNVIKVFGVTKWDTCYGVVMEEAEQNLEDLVIHEKDKKISWAFRLKLFKEIAEGLSYLHYHNPKRAYIHGDLKLQNILLSDDLVVKIADFGAVSLLQETGFSVGSLDIVPTKQYTWLYSAPEFLNNPEMERTRAMDVYSYAMIGYEIITRNQAFVSKGGFTSDIVLRLIMENGQKPNKTLINNVKITLNNDCDRDICCLLESIVVECWQTNPKDRPSIQSVRDELKAFCKSGDYRLIETSFLKKRKTSGGLRKISLRELDSSSRAAFSSASGSPSPSGDCVVSSASKQKNNNQLPVQSGSYIHSCKVFIRTGVDGFVGCGTFSKVHLGFIKYFNTVAVKYQILVGSKEAIKKKRERFIKEVGLLNKANHAHVIRIEGYTSWRSSMGIVMEYLPGGDLHDLLLSQNDCDDNYRYDISSALKLRFSADVSSGITYLHNAFNNKRIVHGDLRPTNILLTSDLRCKVGGFEAADFATRTEDVSTTRSSHVIITPAFAAPERLEHPHHQLKKSMDVYSFGVLVYVIIQRRYPTSSYDLFINDLNQCIQNHKTNADLIVHLLMKHMENCCNKDPINRPLIIDVMNELQPKSCSQNLAAITREVADILEKMSIKIPYLDVKECKPLSELNDNLLHPPL